MNMIEKVARASFACWASEENNGFKFEDMPSDELEFAMKHAKACIEAMRSVPDDCYDKFDCSKMWKDANSKEVWNNWIDAALKEE